MMRWRLFVVFTRVALFSWGGGPASGALAAVTGTVLPTTLLMLVMIIFFFGLKDSPRVRAMLTAVRPVVVALLL